MARGIKRGIEWALGRVGRASLLHRHDRVRTAILAYHNIVPVGECVCGAFSLHTDQSEFARQLEFLLESRDIVTLEQALSGPPTSRSQVVITFDDAYRGAMSAGLEELSRRNLPCTVFVPPGLLGDPGGFWWDRIAGEEGRLDPALQNECMESLKGDQETIVSWARRSGVGLRPVPEHGRICDEADVLEAAKKGVTIANHTWSHANLAALDENAALSEVTRAANWLNERLATPMDCLAYPYGLGGRLAHSTGAPCTYGLLNDGGLARVRGARRHPLLQIPRINVARGLTLDGLSLRLLGLRP